MTAVVLDLDIERLPNQIEDLQQYDRAFILVRFHGIPVGQTWLSVTNGYISKDELHAAIRKMADWPLWDAWLRHRLAIQPVSPHNKPPTTATVAICTRDRSDDLRRCLDALTRQIEDGCEILVVDNCPATETTCQLVQQYDGVRYVREDRPGLNTARNRALREARHEIVVFNDDDAVPEPGWLHALLRNFDDKRVLCVTGLTMPLELETDAQEWFERYSPFQRGFRRVVYDMNRLSPLAGGQVGAGANMALRRCVLNHVGPFDEALDAGTPTQSGGDTEMFSRILAAGYRIVYEPTAVSWHRHRRTWEELRRALYGYGVGIYATWTRNLIYDRELAVLVIALYWFLYDQLPGLIRSLLRRPGALPLDLRLAELKGCFMGPFAYAASRRKLRQQIAQERSSNG